MEQGRPISILAVDDELGVLALVRRCLGDEERVTLIEASSGKKALDRIAKGPALDLLITDLRMPEMEGDELARQVRTLEPDLKVLYLTSHADRLFDAKPALGRGGSSGQAVYARGTTRGGRVAALRPHDAVKLPAMTDDGKNRHDFKTQLGIILGFSAFCSLTPRPAIRDAAISRKFTKRPLPRSTSSRACIQTRPTRRNSGCVSQQESR